jgi:hypothetical protein
MVRFSAFHAIAAQRGEGLRPELLRLLENSAADVEAGAGQVLADPLNFAEAKFSTGTEPGKSSLIEQW